MITTTVDPKFNELFTKLNKTNFLARAKSSPELVLAAKSLYRRES